MKRKLRDMNTKLEAIQLSGSKMEQCGIIDGNGATAPILLPRKSTDSD